jgi:hypothetical protein
MHDGHRAVFVQALEARHAGVESEAVVDFSQLVRGDTDLGPQSVVSVVSVRHQGVETVVGAGQFQHDQDAL